MQGRHTALVITVSPADRLLLEAWQRAPSLPLGQVRRGRIVLRRADGMSIAAIAREAGVTRRNVYQWLQRYQEGGVAALVRYHPPYQPKEESTHA